jgi:hypothetical protein
MRPVSVRPESLHRSGRRYLSLARESFSVASPRHRRLVLTDGPFAETKEKVTGSL